LKYANPGQLFKISPIISGTRRALTARPRRLRKNETMRSMLRETELNARDFIYLLFVRHGEGRTPISSMPGCTSSLWLRWCRKQGLPPS
jgi:Delta-aminolevulinic acid dehydratase